MPFQVSFRSPLEPMLYSVKEVANLIAFSRSKTYEMIRAGTIPHIVVEGRIRVRRRDLLGLVEVSGLRPSGSSGAPKPSEEPQKLHLNLHGDHPLDAASVTR